MLKVGDVVRLNCPDPKCVCMKDSPPAIVVEVRPPNWYVVKFPFEAEFHDWPERAVKLLEEAKCEISVSITEAPRARNLF